LIVKLLSGHNLIRRRSQEKPSFVRSVVTFFGDLFGYGDDDSSELEKEHFKRDAPLPFHYKATTTPVHNPESKYHSKPSLHQPSHVTHHPQPVYHQPEPTYHKPEGYHHHPEPTYHQPEQYHYVDYCNPPEPKFKLRIRTRRDYSCCADDSNADLGVCTQLKDECTDMMTSKKMFNGKMVGQMVDCKNTFRFT